MTHRGPFQPQPLCNSLKRPLETRQRRSPEWGETPLPCWRPLDGQCAEQSTMPFLHGFRRIIFEYQPLVDEILGLLAIQDAERQSGLER